MRREVVQRAEVYALASSIVSIPVAIIFEQILITIAPFSIALTLNTANRRKLENNLRNTLLTQEQNVERLETQNSQLKDLVVRQDRTHVLVEGHADKIFSLEDTYQETSDRLNTQFNEQEQFQKALHIHNSQIPKLASKIEEIDKLDLVNLIINLDQWKNSIQEIFADIAKHSKQLDKLNHIYNDNKNAIHKLSTLHKEAKDRVEGISQKINPFIQKLEKIDIDKISDSILIVSNQFKEIKNNFQAYRTITDQRIDDKSEQLLDLLENLEENIKQAKDSIYPHLSYVELLQQADLVEFIREANLKISQLGTDIDSINEMPASESWVEEFTQEVKRIKPYYYEIVTDRDESRSKLKKALQDAKDRIILVNPWLNSSAIQKDIKELIREFLANTEGTIDIGWGYWRDIVDRYKDRDPYDRISYQPTAISRKEFIERATDRGKEWAYSGLEDLALFEKEYPTRFKLKLIATHEKYFVCDNKIAMLGSHNFLCSTEEYVGEKEVGLETDDPVVIDLLSNRYKNSINWEKKYLVKHLHQTKPSVIKKTNASTFH
ncbi:hypothetical protein ACSYAD_20735 [Acaryochloris marina NIES-2412]|uniref:hypothetical protein n=1 Tax=Acaryochloris marina TaxID=155978 RepID=UPI0040590C5A